MGKNRILLVEDDEDVYEFLKPYLEGRGYVVDVAIDGRSGLKKVQEFQPDLVILDLMMPEVDGFSFLRSLMPARDPSSPRVLVLTAVQKMGGVEEALDMGASAYMTKPVDNERLLEKIQSLL